MEDEKKETENKTEPVFYINGARAIYCREREYDGKLNYEPFSDPPGAEIDAGDEIVKFTFGEIDYRHGNEHLLYLVNWVPDDEINRLRNISTLLPEGPDDYPFIYRESQFVCLEAHRWLPRNRLGRVKALFRSWVEKYGIPDIICQFDFLKDVQ